MYHTFCCTRPYLPDQCEQVILIYIMILDWRWVQDFFKVGEILFLPLWAFFPNGICRKTLNLDLPWLTNHNSEFRFNSFELDSEVGRLVLSLMLGIKENNLGIDDLLIYILQLLCICVLQTVNDESMRAWHYPWVMQTIISSSYHLIKVTLLTVLIPFSDSDQGLCDCVCECHHVLQGKIFVSKEIKQC